MHVLVWPVSPAKTINKELSAETNRGTLANERNEFLLNISHFKVRAYGKI